MFIKLAPQASLLLKRTLQFSHHTPSSSSIILYQRDCKHGGSKQLISRFGIQVIICACRVYGCLLNFSITALIWSMQKNPFCCDVPLIFSFHAPYAISLPWYVYSHRVSFGSLMFFTQWSLSPISSMTYSFRFSIPPGNARWIIGSLNGSRIVIFIVESMLNGSSGLSYCVLNRMPFLYNATSAFSYASARVTPLTVSTGIFFCIIVILV